MIQRYIASGEFSRGVRPADDGDYVTYADHESEVAALRAAKDGAYSERNKLVAALSKAFPARLGRHPDADVKWEDDWRWIVRIDLPTGQATWHIHDSELHLFAHLPQLFSDVAWDGHTNDEKYARVAALPVQEVAALRAEVAEVARELPHDWFPDKSVADRARLLVRDRRDLEAAHTALRAEVERRAKPLRMALRALVEDLTMDEQGARGSERHMVVAAAYAALDREEEAARG